MAGAGDKFGWDLGEMVLSQCAYCKHLSVMPNVNACAAFPGMIPAEFLRNESDHRRPWIDPRTGEPGDQGVPLAGSILFAPRPDVPADVLARLYADLDSIA